MAEGAGDREQELAAVLGKLGPGVSAQVRQVATELVERVVRRVATEVAAARVEQEIERIRRSL